MEDRKRHHVLFRILDFGHGPEILSITFHHQNALKLFSLRVKSPYEQQTYEWIHHCLPKTAGLFNQHPVQ
jgi:hypothetical protein